MFFIKKKPKKTVLQLMLVKTVDHLSRMTDEINLSKSTSEIELLRKVGFTSSPALKEYEDQKKKIKMFNEFIVYANDVYNEYPDAFIIPRSVFLSVLREHNLYCRTFDDYISNVPFDQLKKIDEFTTSSYLSKSCPKIIYKISSPLNLQYFSSVSSDDRKLYKEYFLSKKKWYEYLYSRSVYRSQFIEDITRLPFYYINSNTQALQNNVLISDFTNEVNKELKEIFTLERDVVYAISCSEKIIDNIFIVAPINMFKSLPDIRVDNKKSNLDPLICKLSNEKFKSILVLTGWGDEMNYPEIEKYYNLMHRMIENVLVDK